MSGHVEQIVDENNDNIYPISAVSGSSYCKMADGTLIQWGKGSGTTYTHTYIYPFISKPVVVVSPRGSQHQVNYDDNASTASVLKINIAQDRIAYFAWIAVGRWR